MNRQQAENLLRIFIKKSGAMKREDDWMQRPD